VLFFELTWSPISQPAKDAIAFDNTAVYAHRRTSVNKGFKQFVTTSPRIRVVGQFGFSPRTTAIRTGKLYLVVAEAVLWHQANH
jgi:hypothetical protein